MGFPQVWTQFPPQTLEAALTGVTLSVTFISSLYAAPRASAADSLSWKHRR